MPYKGSSCTFDCTETKSAKIIDNHELEKQLDNSIIISDNYIELTGQNDYENYSIFDIMGRKIIESNVNSNKIYTNTLTSGTYIIRLQKSDLTSENHKFIVQ